MGLAESGLDQSDQSIVALAAAIATGTPGDIRAAVDRAVAAGVTPRAIDELILQSVLTVGWPRALVAAGAWRAVPQNPAPEEDDDVDYSRHAEWTRRGERVCRVIYGDHYERLRENVHELHPALEAWMVTEGYGRTLARPGLDLRVRELCTVAQTAILRTPRQLHSHLLGALRSGASFAQIDATLAIVRPAIDEAARSEYATLWQRVRERWTPA